MLIKSRPKIFQWNGKLFSRKQESLKYLIFAHGIPWLGSLIELSNYRINCKIKRQPKLSPSLWSSMKANYKNVHLHLCLQTRLPVLLRMPHHLVLGELLLPLLLVKEDHLHLPHLPELPRLTFQMHLQMLEELSHLHLHPCEASQWYCFVFWYAFKCNFFSCHRLPMHLLLHHLW